VKRIGIEMVGQAYATKEMVLEVELDVGVLLDGAEDLKNAVRVLMDVRRSAVWSYLHALCGDLVLGETCQHMSFCQWHCSRLYLWTAVVA
jgi:hypothetical protein